MELLFYFFIFIFGTFVGSFLGVVIDRLPRGESIIKGRSHCDHCKKILAPRDLVPLLSFLFLRGKCRQCGKRLSLFYPVVEVVTGVLFVLTFFIFHALFSFDFFFVLFIVSILITLFFIDLKFGIIPFLLVLVATVVTVVYLVITMSSGIIPHLIAGLGAFAFFLALFLLTRGRGMGFGDVVYVFFMGLLLGFPSIVFGLYIAFVSGALVAVLLVVLHKKHIRGSTIPFGPFLVFGTLVCLFWGDQLANIVLRFLLG